MIDTFERFLDRALEVLVVLCFVTILGIVITLCGLRYVFNTSITGANELITVLFVYTTAIGAALAIGRREDISIVAIIDRLDIRRRRWADIFGLLSLAALNIAVCAYGLVWIDTTGNFLMPSTELPRVVAQFSIPLGSGLSVLYSIFALRRLFVENPPESGIKT